ncbi:Hypothetical protein PACV_78 [Pacmanvirus A23]|uniref:Hypothetical protein n=1 Tax=Pacmanvirus A23 TaxID=1932881 RepID=UPI000A094733|nr:Hypothetical protein B9W72_gp078 [Pacmanvirus A23]SIP85795.1 Hypothetical protein PACV_78 [Pacmanvirus A23]
MDTTIGISIGDRIIVVSRDYKHEEREEVAIVLDIKDDKSLFAMNKYTSISLYNIKEIKGVTGSIDIDDEIRGITSKLASW